MKAYIERAAAMKAILGLTIVDPAVAQYANAVYYHLQNLPAADVVEVRHGRWIVTDVVTCSECQHFTRSEFAGRWKYCPNCGALMMEVENGEK